MLLNSFLDSPIVILERNRVFVEILNVGWGAEPVATLSRTGRIIWKDLNSRGVQCRDLRILGPQHYPMLLRRGTIVDQVTREATSRACNRAAGRVRDGTGEQVDGTIPDLTFQEWSRAAEIQQWLDRLQSGPTRHCASMIIDTPERRVSRVLMTPYVCLLQIDGLEYLAAYEQILALKDASLARGNVYFGCSLFEDPSRIQRIVTRVLMWTELCWMKYRNGGADILKALEPLAKAYCTEMTCSVFSGPGGTYDLQIQAVRMKERSLGNYDPTTLTDMLDSLLRELDVEEVVEAFGLMKLTCHPEIDPVLGGRSAAEEARVPSMSTQESADRLKWSWRRMYCIGYIKKFGKWPPLQFSPAGMRTVLFSAHSRDDQRLSRNTNPLSDWEHIRFIQHAEFDYFPDYLELQDDRSLSYLRSEKNATWDGGRTSTDRRLFVELLSRESFSLASIFQQIADSGIPKDWLIVSLYPKEREFKRKARMFAMLTLEMRSVLTCLESNVAEKVLSCFPQQTMTLDRDTILKMFLSKSGRAELDRLFVEIDFKRWNLHWREENHSGIAYDLNDIFGVEHHFEILHQFFSSSVIMLRHPSHRPIGVERDPAPESDALWYNHLGGFEGLGQKVWSIMTYAFCDLAMDQYDLPYTLIGQGDNQVFVVDTTSLLGDKTEIDRVGRGLAAAVSHEADRIDQSVKPEECLYSTTVITYSKDFFVHGALLHSSLKALSRVFFRSVDDMPASSSRITGAFSSAATAAQKSRDPLRLYILATAVSTFGLLNAVRSSAWWIASELSFLAPQFHSGDFIADLLWCPPALGGMALSPADFLYRGSADPASKELAPLARGSRRDPWMIHVGRMLAGLTPCDVSLDILLEVPHALPVPRKESLTSLIKRELLTSSRRITKNRDLIPLMELSKSNTEAEFKKSLLSVRPLNPYVARDIYSSSAYGARDEIFTLVTSSRTAISIRSRASRVEGDGDEDRFVDISSAILLNEALPFIYLSGHLTAAWKEMSSGRPPLDLPSTGYDTAVALRNLFGIPLIGISAATAMDSTRTLTGPRVGVIVPETVSSKLRTTNGQRAPLFGMKTAARRSSYGFKIATVGKGERALAKLAELREIAETESFQAVVDAAISSRTRIDLSSLSHLLSVKTGGTLSHRYLSAIRDRSANANGAEMISTHVIANSNECGLWAGGELDYPVMFQEFFALAQALILRGSCDGMVEVSLTARQDLPPIDEAAPSIAMLPPPNLPLVESPLSRVSSLIIVSSTGALGIPGVVEASGIDGPSLSELVASAMLRRTRYDLPAATASTRSTLKLGFAEMQRVSINTMVDAIACTILLETSPLILADASMSLPRISAAQQDLARSLIRSWLGDPALARTLSPQLRVMQLAVPTTRYGGTSSYAEEALLTISLKRAIVLAQAGTLRPPLIYSDDSESAVSDSLIGYLSYRVLHASLKDSRSATVARSVYSLSVRRLRMFRRGSGAEVGREVNFAVEFYAQEAVIQNVPVLHAEMVLLRTKGIGRIVPVPIDLAIRKIREWPAIVPPVQAIGSRRNLIAYTTELPPSLNLEEAKLRRRACAIGAGWSSAHAAWAQMARSYVPRAAIMIGVGEGAAAAALLLAGVGLIHGIDKLTDLSDSALVGGEDVPAIISLNGLRAGFCRLGAQRSPGSEWPSPEIATSIDRETVADSPVLLDYSTHIATIATDLESRRILGIEREMWKRVVCETAAERSMLSWVSTRTDSTVFICYKDDFLVEALIRLPVTCSWTQPGRSRDQLGDSLVWRAPAILPPASTVALMRASFGASTTTRDAEQSVLSAISERRMAHANFTNMLLAVVTARFRGSGDLTGLSRVFRVPVVQRGELKIFLDQTPGNLTYVYHILPKLL